MSKEIFHSITDKTRLFHTDVDMLDFSYVAENGMSDFQPFQVFNKIGVDVLMSWVNLPDDNLKSTLGQYFAGQISFI